ASSPVCRTTAKVRLPPRSSSNLLCIPSSIATRTRRAPLRTTAVCHFIEREHGGAGGGGDEGKRPPLEGEQQQAPTHAGVGHAAGKRLRVGPELGKPERMLRVEQSEGDRQGERADERRNAVQGSIEDGDGETKRTLAPGQALLADACTLSKPEQHGAVGV